VADQKPLTVKIYGNKEGMLEEMRKLFGEPHLQERKEEELANCSPSLRGLDVFPRCYTIGLPKSGALW
jgi:hypothetical protein